jgi:hypothetical protein
MELTQPATVIHTNSQATGFRNVDSRSICKGSEATDDTVSDLYHQIVPYFDSCS